MNVTRLALTAGCSALILAELHSLVFALVCAVWIAGALIAAEWAA